MNYPVWLGTATRVIPSAHRPLQKAAKIEWSDISLGAELGRSVNNIVRHATLPDSQKAAIKLYGHTLVTDGLPIDDMNACLQIGTHQNVIGGIGEVINVPNDRQALIMPLIPSEFKNPGKPPNLATVCRDTYSPEQSFSTSYVREIIRTVASGMRHLHQQGVIHGDLYAHNILTNENGESYIGDFGAASLYSPGSMSGLLRERVDVRAFGILIDELLTRCIPLLGEETDIAEIGQLASGCLSLNPEQRPTFADIVANHSDLWPSDMR